MSGHGAPRDFFERIAEQGFDPRLGQAKGSLRFEVSGRRPENRLVVLDRGSIRVSQEDGEPDVTVTADEETFDGLQPRRRTGIQEPLGESTARHTRRATAGRR